MSKIKSEKTIKVFVYGTLKVGFRLSHSTEHLRKNAWEHEIPGELYDTGFGYPAGYFSPNSLLSIHGEVHEFEQSALQRLDSIEGVPHLYKRRVIDHDEIGQDIWIYEMVNLPKRAKLIKSGVWED